jgi:hypothetical protein
MLGKELFLLRRSLQVLDIMLLVPYGYTVFSCLSVLLILIRTAFLIVSADLAASNRSYVLNIQVLEKIDKYLTEDHGISNYRNQS